MFEVRNEKGFSSILKYSRVLNLTYVYICIIYSKTINK